METVGRYLLGCCLGFWSQHTPIFWIVHYRQGMMVITFLDIFCLHSANQVQFLGGGTHAGDAPTNGNSFFSSSHRSGLRGWCIEYRRCTEQQKRTRGGMIEWQQQYNPLSIICNDWRVNYTENKRVLFILKAPTRPMSTAWTCFDSSIQLASAKWRPRVSTWLPGLVYDRWVGADG